jgi:delta24(24(1))-sterol reductase
MVMIIHRTTRDVARCRRKYGEAWTRYEKAVPYLFIPVSYKSLVQSNEHLLMTMQYVI